MFNGCKSERASSVITVFFFLFASTYLDGFYKRVCFHHCSMYCSCCWVPADCRDKPKPQLLRMPAHAIYAECHPVVREEWGETFAFTSDVSDVLNSTDRHFFSIYNSWILVININLEGDLRCRWNGALHRSPNLQPLVGMAQDGNASGCICSASTMIWYLFLSGIWARKQFYMMETNVMQMKKSIPD